MPSRGLREVEAEATKAEGTAAFESGDCRGGRVLREAASLQPGQPIHWSNLAVARLRGGRPEAAVEAATEATSSTAVCKGVAPLGRGADGAWRRSRRRERAESGLQRAEGAIRLALTKALQKAKPQATALRASLVVVVVVVRGRTRRPSPPL